MAVVPIELEPVPLQRPTVVVDGHRVGLTVTGEGEPLLLLHGIGRDRGDWSPVVPALARRFRVYAIDIEGFGRSEPWSDRITLGSMAHMVRRTLASQGEHRPIHVVGNSMGGSVALRLAADAPAEVADLVLISPAGFGSDAAFGFRLLTLPRVGPLVLRAVATRPVLRLRARTVDRTPILRQLAAAEATRLHRPGMVDQYLQVVHDLGGWSGVKEQWRSDVLREVAAARTPTLVLWGDRDTVLPHAHLAAVASVLPHAVTRSLPGSGHSPQVEDPEMVVGLIEGFAGSLR